MSISSYTIYGSSTLDAVPGQPTGASKLCLSCHDGTLALGSVLNRTDQIRMLGGEFLPSGLTNLDTDLSDDHPISFYYTSGLAASDSQLVDPQALPPQIRLDASEQLQCTACHDPHNNQYGGFLVMGNEFGALCTACHDMDGWLASPHKLSSASVSGAPSGNWPYATVAENACRSCHRPHTAGGRERLLILEAEEENCLNCHGGQVASRNILTEIDKVSAHDPRRYVGIHDPVETPSGQQPHVECADCHNPHAVSKQPPTGNYYTIGAPLAKVRGVTQGGMLIDEAQHEFEVCYRCHADAAVTISSAIFRQSQTPNMRLRFSPTNPSYHPVVTSSPSTDTVSLIPGLPSGSLIRCTDCHGNDDGPGSGGMGPGGPHGSIYDFLLERNYTTQDDTSESQFEYDLCYKCHRRTSILNDESFPEHDEHVRGANAPCSACHDPHGVTTLLGAASDHTHLINFDLQIVRPDPGTGRLEFRDLGRFAGSCTLICHGVVHVDENYSKFGLLPAPGPGTTPGTFRIRRSSEAAGRDGPPGSLGSQVGLLSVVSPARQPGRSADSQFREGALFRYEKQR
jgi:predicted CXXCH cytochrome family protein